MLLLVFIYRPRTTDLRVESHPIHAWFRYLNYCRHYFYLLLTLHKRNLQFSQLVYPSLSVPNSAFYNIADNFGNNHLESSRHHRIGLNIQKQTFLDFSLPSYLHTPCKTRATKLFHNSLKNYYRTGVAWQRGNLA